MRLLLRGMVSNIPLSDVSPYASQTPRSHKTGEYKDTVSCAQRAFSCWSCGRKERRTPRGGVVEDMDGEEYSGSTDGPDGTGRDGQDGGTGRDGRTGRTGRDRTGQTDSSVTALDRTGPDGMDGFLFLTRVRGDER